MKRHSFFAVSLFLLFASCILVSCMDAEKSYREGDYEGVVKALEWKKVLTNDDYILKADSLFALGRYDESLKDYMLFLLLTDSSAPQRQHSISRFVQLNGYDSLTILIVDKSDGFEARKALYRAYAGLGDTERAVDTIGLLANEMTYSQLVSFVLERPVEGESIARLFSSWWFGIEEGEKKTFLDLLCQYSEMDGLDEKATRICLETTDAMIADSYYTQDDALLSALLKTKGNILEKLYDRINARMYWNQAYRLNPDDVSLLEKLGR